MHGVLQVLLGIVFGVVYATLFLREKRVLYPDATPGVYLRAKGRKGFVFLLLLRYCVLAFCIAALVVVQRGSCDIAASVSAFIGAFWGSVFLMRR